LIEQARLENKDLQAARFAIELSKAKLLQAGVRANPVLSASGRSDALFDNKGGYSRSIGISQTFPITGRLLREKDVARVDVAMAEAEVADAERRLAGEVADDAYRLLVIDRQIAARDDLIAAESQLARTTRARFKAAEVSELDVNTVQLDLRRLGQERAQWQTQHETTLIDLNTRLGRAASAPLMIVEPLPSLDALQGLAHLQDQALELRPDLRGALLAVDRAEAERALARASRWEDWSVAVELSQDKLVLDGGPRQGADRALGVSVSIPLPLVGERNRGALAEAEASRDAATAGVEALRLKIAGEVAGAHAEASRLQASMDTYERDIRPVAARNTKLAEDGYRQGLIPLADVVQARRQQVDLETGHLATLDAYLQALARLHTAVGDYLTPMYSGSTP
jgi:cobalt-zinc-cadmium efflux system outer membrane protein